MFLTEFTSPYSLNAQREWHTSEQTAIISLYNINWLVFITEREYVYCAVRTGSLNLCDFILQRDSQRLFPTAQPTDDAIVRSYSYNVTVNTSLVMRGRSERVRKISPFQGLDPRTIQSLYPPTDGPERTAKITFPRRSPKIRFLKSDFLEGYFIKQLRLFCESKRLSLPWQYYFRFLTQNCQLALRYIHRSFLRPNIDPNRLYKYYINRLPVTLIRKTYIWTWQIRAVSGKAVLNKQAMCVRTM